MSTFDTWPPVRIAGTGSYVPERVVTNDELAGTLDTSDAWIIEHTGIHERRWASASEATSDLAAAACTRALEAAHVDVSDIDLVVVATSTPDFTQPATATVVHGLLGMRGDAAAFDANAVCSGFVYALHSASAMLACTDMWNNALVVGADCYSRITNPDDRLTRVFFGDGAGAVVLEKTLAMGEVSLMAASEIGIESGAPDPEGGLSEDETPGIRAVTYLVDPRRREAIIVPAGGSREPADAAAVEAARQFFTMDGPAVKAFAVEEIARAVEEACGDAEIVPGDLALIVAHQSNRRVLEAAVDELGLPEGRMEITVDRYGNTAAASIPLTLDHAVRAGRVRAGDMVCLVGYGGGLASAACVLRW